MKASEIDLYVPIGSLLATSYCRETIVHGEVSIYIKSNLDLDYSVIDLNTVHIEGTLEVVGMVSHTHKILIVSIYRTPGSDVDIKL